MCFVTLKLRVRIDQRIFVVEAGYITDIEHAILHAVDPAAAISRRIGRKAERVCDSSGWITIVGQLPQLFHADAVNLRVTARVESQTFDEFLGQRAAWSFAQ